MKEIALYTLDIAQNSITAQARRLDITLTEEWKTITLSIRDDGTGMAPELLARVSDPFTTTRTTRSVGLGLPLLRLAAEQTGGSLSIESALAGLEPPDRGWHIRIFVQKAQVADNGCEWGTNIMGQIHYQLIFPLFRKGRFRLLSLQCLLYSI